MAITTSIEWILNGKAYTVHARHTPAKKASIKGHPDDATEGTGAETEITAIEDEKHARVPRPLWEKLGFVGSEIDSIREEIVRGDDVPDEAEEESDDRDSGDDDEDVYRSNEDE